MNNYLRLILLSLICLLLDIIHLSGEELFSNEVTLFSVHNGKPIATTPIRIEAKSQDKNNKEYILSIGDRSGIRGTDGKDRTIWIFGESINAQDLSKTSSSIRIKDIHIFKPFYSDKKVIFKLSAYREVETQIKISFTVQAPPGDNIPMTLHMYVASPSKKRTTIEDEVEVKFAFTIPVVNTPNENKINSGKEGTTMIIDTDVNPSISLTRQDIEQREDSIKQVRIQELDLYISDKNQEISEILTTLNKIGTDIKYEKSFVDSLENVTTAIQRTVGYKESGSGDILPFDDNLINKFTEFSIIHSTVVKKIEEVKEAHAKPDWGKQAPFIIGGMLFGGMFFMQIWSHIKIKIQQRKIKKQTEEATRKMEWDSIDINDLDSI